MVRTLTPSRCASVFPAKLTGCPYTEFLDQCVEALDPRDEGLDAQHATTLTDRARHAFVGFVTFCVLDAL